MEGRNYNPKRIIQFYDGRMCPKNESFEYVFLRKMFVIILIILILGLILFKEFILGGPLLFIIVICVLIKSGGHTRVKCYSELQFYDDCMIFYVPKHHIKRNKDNMEIQKMFYKDVKECTYRVNTKKYVIFGELEETHYRYKNNQVIYKAPKYHKKYDGMIKFYTVFDNGIDFKKEIENFTPLKVKEETI